MNTVPTDGVNDSANNSTTKSRHHAPRLMDFIEKSAIIVLYGLFLQRMLIAYVNTGNLGTLTIIITETMLVALVIFRKPANDFSTRWLDWLLAASATSLPLLTIPTSQPEHPWDAFAVSLTFIGLGIQVLSKLTLGRRFGIVAANRGICSAGPYRLVRHPIYLGYLFTHAGFLMLFPTPWNFAVFAVLYSLKSLEFWLKNDCSRKTQAIETINR